MPVQPFASLVLAANIIEIFERCGTIDKTIVLGLALFSLVAWTIMFGKHHELKRLRALNLAFEQHLRDQRSLLDVPDTFRAPRSIPYADLFADAIECYRRAAAHDRERGRDDPRARLEQSENAIQRAIARQTLRYESNMIFLASIVSGAPFIGLLGTVWGVMDAFSGIAQAGQASLAAMAPGVSGALITTVVGLLVAIPAMFGYNFLTTYTRSFIVEMENFAAECAAVFEHRFTSPRS